MPSSGHWILTDSLFFVNNLFLYGKNDEPLGFLLRRIYSGVVGKMMSYAECTHGIHFFANTMSDDNGHIQGLEFDHLYLDVSTSEYLGKALYERQPTTSSGCVTDHGLPCYVRRSVTNHFEARGIHTDLFNRLTSCPVCFSTLQKRSEWQPLFDFLNDNSQGDHPDGQSVVDCQGDNVLVIPLATPSTKLPAGSLGTILLWGDRRIGTKTSLLSRGERLIAPTKVISVFLQRLFESHHRMTCDTYLPSFRRAEEKSIAIMFADIRDFTPTTEICRNHGLGDTWKQFMLDYCSEMCEIIRREGGRVHALAGDGIEALFGEYTSDSRKVVRDAVIAARKMCQAFQGLRGAFFAKPEVAKFRNEESLAMDIRLGIGIDFGLVVFDYFGAPGSRVYSPLGDHVNTAQRLESEASHYDDLLHRRRAPILLSRPAWLKDPQGPDSPIAVHPKGKLCLDAYEIIP